MIFSRCVVVVVVVVVVVIFETRDPTRPDATRPDATRRVFATDEGTEEKDSLPAAIQIGDDDEVERVVEIG